MGILVLIFFRLPLQRKNGTFASIVLLHFLQDFSISTTNEHFKLKWLDKVLF